MLANILDRMGGEVLVHFTGQQLLGGVGLMLAQLAEKIGRRYQIEFVEFTGFSPRLDCR